MYLRITQQSWTAAYLRAVLLAAPLPESTSFATPLSGHGSCLPKTSTDPHYRQSMVVVYVTCPRIAHRPLSCTSVAVVGHDMHSARSIPSWNFHARRWSISTDRSIDRESDVTKESTKRILVQIKIYRKRCETSGFDHFNNDHGRAKNKVSVFPKYSH